MNLEDIFLGIRILYICILYICILYICILYIYIYIYICIASPIVKSDSAIVATEQKVLKEDFQYMIKRSIYLKYINKYNKKLYKLLK